MTIYSKPIAQPANLIGKSSLEGMKSIVGQLQELCLFQRYAIDGCFNVSIQRFDLIARPDVQLADNGIRGRIKIADSIGFTHEFRIRNQTEITSSLPARV